jgi:poly(3-hydroxybutyrate) depolymerase
MMIGYQTLANAPLYTAIELAKASLLPFRMALTNAIKFNDSHSLPFKEAILHKSVMATIEVMERMTREYPKPEWGIDSVMVDGKKAKINVKVIKEKSFCDLIHFEKSTKHDQPKMLVVVPLSGHYPTLLRGTIEDLLPHFDVYATEWKNARDIPVELGQFNMDDYINYLINFFTILGPDLHVMAVCQPCVPVAAAVAIMSSDKQKATPKSMILIGGPVDIRESPTFVNNYAEDRNLEWFKQNVITYVSANHPGYMRYVYPGFIQLSGFLAMNPQKHIEEHVKLFKHLVEGDEDGEDKMTKFYDEYMSVMDIPAEFYLQTIKAVFHDCSLPSGKMESYGRPVNLSDIEKTALLVIEGELDDITGVGQTKAAVKLCNNLPNDMKHYHLQKGVGHYGQFNGSKYRQFIVPLMQDFCNQIDKTGKYKA